MATDLRELQSVAIDVARCAGAVLRDRPAGLAVATKTTPTDAVTEMDRAAEAFILTELARRRPGDGVIGEEGASRPSQTGVVWVVDPLDGTVNYLYGIPHYAVSVAADVDGSAVAGAVYDVCRDEIYAATAGGGATRDGERLRCSTQSDPAFALVATGFSYAAATRASQAAVVEQLLPRVRDIRRMGSAALDLCAVATGRVDAFFEAGMNPWDWAAGALIAREAGAVAGGLEGRPPGTWTTLVANPALFAELEAMLVAAGAAGVDVVP